MLKHTFLLEIGTEEIPARFMAPALKQFQETAEKELREARLEHGQIRVFGTPRRLALLVDHLAERQQDLHEKKKGPAVKAAYDADGNPTNAVKGFARSQGVTVDNLFSEEVDGVAYVFAQRHEQGRDTYSILPALCERLIRSLNFPKPMFWYSKDIRFARPIRWLTALYGAQVIPFTFAGLQSAAGTYGHRFLAPAAIALAEAGQYPEAMENAFVIAEPAKRQAQIAEQVRLAAAQLGGYTTLDEDLLEEVVNLVEYPKAVTGEFSRDYLEIPPEVLITAMRAHQRYFPVFDADNRLLPYFITVSNGTQDQFAANVRAGNERVLRARLADARFFFDEDRKREFASYVDMLDNIVFMEPLGTMRKKVERLVILVEKLADALALPANLRQDAARAAFLAKADLMTHMVYEFPELQGTMGMHYARLAGENNHVAAAIHEHYAPRFAGDAPAASLPGALVAIADKMDTLAACFGLGLIPSGSQDPYALRRSATGVVTTLAAHNLAVPIREVCSVALDGLDGQITRPVNDVLPELEEFLLQRVRYTFAEQGLRYDVVDAALAGSAGDLPGLLARALLLQGKLDTPELTRILTPFTRAANLTREFQGADVDESLFASEAEHDLYRAATAAAGDVRRAAGSGDFTAVFNALSPLSGAIDRFFADVMVMADDPDVRRNRLALLSLVRGLFLTLGDLSKIVQEKK